MASPSFFRSSNPQDLFVCARCAFRACKIVQKNTRRAISTGWLKKTADAETQWQIQALEIKDGKKKSMLKILEERGLVHNVTGSRDDVERMMTEKRLGAYVGIDPTASSLHVGHMLPLMSLFWMYVHGYQAITLIGGATAKIGDPTDRLKTRPDVHRSLRTKYMVDMHYQLKKLWINVEAYGLKYGYRWEWAWKRGLVNNTAWMNKLPIMEFLQVLGPGVRIGSMLAKDTVKNKMQKGDGVSYAEFSYPLLQAWDWWHMYNANGVRLQIGGSDQYGNITAGVDAVKYIAANHPAPDTPKKTTEPPFGFTTPLLTTSAGTKFGKSAGNAIWLSNEMTGTFDLYGYFLRTSDADVGKYLKLFTFMPLEDIDALLKEHEKDPSQRKAQHKLAREFVELVHGAKEAKSVETQHRLVFQKSSSVDTEPELTDASTSQENSNGVNALKLGHITLNNRPKAHMKLPRSFVETKSIGRILYACGLAVSASEGHRLAAQQSVYIGGNPGIEKRPMDDGALMFTSVKLWMPEDTKKYLIDGVLIFRRGKNNIRVVEVVDDEEYEKSGLTFPGMEKMQPKYSALQDGKTPMLGNDAEDRDMDRSILGHDSHSAEMQERMERQHEGEIPKLRDRHEPIYEEEYEDDLTPEERISKLRSELRMSKLMRQEKIDKKNAPKGRFMGHNLPRGPVPGRDRF